MKRHRGRNRERVSRRTVDRWQWVCVSRSGRRWVAITLTVSDRGIVRVQPRRAHLVGTSERRRAADESADWLDAYLPDRLDAEQRYALLWG